ncbi:deoxyribose-phosphate aldolase [Acetobacterium woodii]|uniref:Deoxyribose-phosphate aldolase n=1 Tax=Acetobacterium woodii (strain ATCC 29683 / DSM 1030 / JCM 2381 / KCTC 1655 / WB1) TaxID=931626 RepID=H6LE06_ACEWD|nr:deoxyribose-phosphate aldolase [Acetobacterium woodii]AFA48049.1 deoxyribose-phosphate aldolase DeoC4 [Acetobacterium woodii DSM 1030]
MVDLSKMTKWEIGKLFDYSVLPKNSTEAMIRQGCRDAIKYNAKAFCFSSSYWTKVVVEELQGTDLMIGAAIGFPFGQQSSAVKAFETEEAVRMGATVLDNCMNVGALKDKKYDEMNKEFKEYVSAAGGMMTKMIIETCLLTKEEIAVACKLVAEAGIDWVKTSTGQYAGPSVQDVMIMVDTLKDTQTKVKVAGVKAPRPQNAFAFFAAGAELIGTQGAAEILDAVEDLRKIGLCPAYVG